MADTAVVDPDFSDFDDNSSVPTFKPPKSKRTPFPWTSTKNPLINPVWIAEYMLQHDLSLEVAKEHLAVYMRDFIKQASRQAELLEGSDERTSNNIKVFVDTYKPIEGYYTEMPLINVLNKGSECPVQLKKSLLKDSLNSSKD